MEKLPPEIVLEIFYRLPPESVVGCKFVCKSWRSLLLPCGDDDGNYFANMHLIRRRRQYHQQDYSTFNCIGLQEFRDNDQEEEGSVVGEFHIAEYNEVEGLHCTVKRLTFSQICNISGWLMRMSRLVGSCNGLLCFTITYQQRGTKNNDDSLKARIGICNPLLHEYVILPPSDLQGLQFSIICTGFGYNPITDEYKVVIVYYRRRHSYYIGDVEVYTLGKSSTNAGMWRSKGTIKYALWTSRPQPGLINGSIHWLAKVEPESEQNIIVSFDLEDEEFRVIPLPSNLNNITDMPDLRELRGCLCLIEDIWEHENGTSDIWVLKDNMNREESWVKEFSIKWAVALSGVPWYSPVAIKKNKKDGDVILCLCEIKGSNYRLVSYDPKTENFEKVGGRQEDVFSGMIFCNWVLHINSLVSLNALGEDAKYAEESSPRECSWIS